MAILTTERGYKLRANGPDASTAANGQMNVGTSADAVLKVVGLSVYVQNTGTATIYMAAAPNVTTQMWPIVAGRIAGPFSANDSLYFRAAAATTLNWVFVEEG